MKPKHITVGIDIGTYQIKVVVASSADGEKERPKIIGTGFAESKGLRHGYIINQSDTIRSITAAIEQAKKSSGVKIKRAFLSIGGIGLSSVVSVGSTIISRADSEITELDVKKVLESCESEIPASLLLNKKIIHTIPLQFKIDGKIVLGKPVGMRGMKLEVKALFLVCLEHHLNDLIQAVDDAGIEVIDVMVSSLAASMVTLTKTQKIAGCVLANIGAETLSIVVYENNIPVSFEVFPIGSTDITNDIALGLRIPLEEAEQIKLGAITSSSYPKKKLDEIISARLSDMFDLIEAHLKKIGRNGLLPAGIIITGGGGGIASVDEMAKQALKLPSRVVHLQTESAKGNVSVKDSTWSVAYGLCIWGITADESSSIVLPKKTLKKIISWVKRFLP